MYDAAGCEGRWGASSKKFLFGSMALITLGMSAPAMAADMPVKAPPPVAVAVATWTGCYIGANIGLGHGKFKN